MGHAQACHPAGEPQSAALCGDRDLHMAGVVDRIEVDTSDRILYVELILYVIRITCGEATISRS